MALKDDLSLYISCELYLFESAISFANLHHAILIAGLATVMPIMNSIKKGTA